MVCPRFTHVVAGNVFQMLYGAADAAAVGRLAGLDRLAAVGATGPLSFLVLGFLLGLTGGFVFCVFREISLLTGLGDLRGDDRALGKGFGQIGLDLVKTVRRHVMDLWHIQLSI